MKSKAGSILKFLSVWLLSACIWGHVLHAANPVIVKGIVSDQDNYPLAGAAVLVKGTSEGTIADEKGEFTISAQKGQVLIISFIGFQDKSVEITDQLTYFINLSEDANVLEEIVVVGYDTQKKVCPMRPTLSVLHPCGLRDRLCRNTDTHMEKLLKMTVILRYVPCPMREADASVRSL